MAQVPLQRPTDRQQLIIELVAQGLTNREIAESLGTSDTAVKNYVREIFLKVGVRSRLELALWYEEQKFRRRKSICSCRNRGTRTTEENSRMIGELPQQALPDTLLLLSEQST